MKLLVDVGNSRLKWARLDATGPLAPGGVFAHAQVALGDALAREWRDLADIEAVHVASVVEPAREDELAAIVRERFGLGAQFARSPAAALGVRNAYAQPARLGVDRFLAMVAAQAAAPRLQVLASVGTALTIDALAADGEHLGGVIVPSPLLMRRAVIAANARVELRAEGRYRDWPASTDDGVYSGALQAAAGAIERFRAALAKRCGAPAALLLGGGGSDELAPLLPAAQRVHDLVLQGLAHWARSAPA